MQKVMQVAPCEALLSLDAIEGLAAFLNTLPMSRRKVLDWLAEVIFGWIAEDGVILDGEGNEIVIYPDTIDDTHGEDASLKCVSDMRRRCTYPPQRRPRKTLWLRLALYDAAARITTGKSIIGFGNEQHDGTALNRCPDCGRLIQPWPKNGE